VRWKFKQTCERAHEIGTSHALASKQRFAGEEKHVPAHEQALRLVGFAWMSRESQRPGRGETSPGFARIPRSDSTAGSARGARRGWAELVRARRAVAKVSREPAADFARIRSSDSNGPPPLVGHGGIGPRPLGSLMDGGLRSIQFAAHSPTQHTRPNN
jgi:hypothetical protein